MSAADDTRDWVARAEGAAQALRALRGRLLALHAELSGIREAMGVAAETATRPSLDAVTPPSLASLASSPSIPSAASRGSVASALTAPENDAPTASPFVWPPGRTPN